MLASVNRKFAFGVASVNEESLAHIGVRHAKRLSIESDGRIGPVSSRMGICKGLLHRMTYGENASSVHALCPCGCCAECSMHSYIDTQEVDKLVATNAPLPCACATGTCPTGIMWCLKDHRVQQVEGEELRWAMHREYFVSSPYSSGGSRAGIGVRLVQFKPDCLRGIHPDNHGLKELRGHRTLESLREDLNIADEAAPGFDECTSRVSRMVGQQEYMARELTRSMIGRMCRCPEGGYWIHDEQRYSVRGELCEMEGVWPYKPHAGACVDGAGGEQTEGSPCEHDALTMVRLMRATGEFGGVRGEGKPSHTSEPAASGVGMVGTRLLTDQGAAGEPDIAAQDDAVQDRSEVLGGDAVWEMKGVVHKCSARTVSSSRYCGYVFWQKTT